VPARKPFPCSNRGLVRRIAGHGTAALDALLILGRHGGQAVREWKAEQSDHGQSTNSRLPIILK